MADADRMALAALLHDVGKFWQRTRIPKPYASDLEDSFCPRQGTRPTHIHAVWSGHFVETFVRDDGIASLVYRHHRPTEPDLREVMALSLADWLSSGERVEEEDASVSRVTTSLLHSVLGALVGSSSGSDDRLLFLLRCHTQMDADAFLPVSEGESQAEEYLRCWSGFESAARALTDAQRTSIDTWYFLLRHWAIRVPAATARAGYVPDVSLFDHARVTAALCTCLYLSPLSIPDLEGLRTRLQHAKEQADAPLFTLICGDLSGIQRFVYDVATDEAARTLKGRSFFLKLLSDAAARLICDVLGLNITNVITNSGGHFFVLAPRTAAAQLDAASDTVNSFLTREFGGDLTIALGAAALSPADFVLAGRFARKWGEAAQAAGAWKRSRYTVAAAKDFASVFGPLDEGGAEPECPVCQRSVRVGQERCDLCEKLAALGNDLRQARFLAEWSEPPADAPSYADILEPLRGRWYTAERSAPSRGCLSALWQINGFDVEELVGAGGARAAPTIGYLVHGVHAPTAASGRGIACFSELAERSTGDRKLGVLRADVDDLGAAFSAGLGEKATISRVAALSQLLVDFFEGRVSELLRSEFAETTYLVYSGGDDLFLVGAWDQVADLAVRLEREFSRFTGGRLTLSAGIEILHPKFPLLQAARLAGGAEETAKSYRRAGREKAAVTLLGATLGWEELTPYLAARDDLIALLAEGHGGSAGRGLLRKLYDVWTLYQRERALLAKEQVSAEELASLARWSRWRWMLVYGLRSVVGREPGDRMARVKHLQDQILAGGLEDRFGLALRWAELATRRSG